MALWASFKAKLAALFVYLFGSGSTAPGAAAPTAAAAASSAAPLNSPASAASVAAAAVAAAAAAAGVSVSVSVRGASAQPPTPSATAGLAATGHAVTIDVGAAVHRKPATPAPSTPAAVRAERLLRERSAIKIQALLRGHAARRLAKRTAADARKRRFIANEILSTERTYVDSLRTLDALVVGPLQRNDSIIAREQLDRIFGGVSTVIRTNDALKLELEARLAAWDSNPCLGDLFVRYAPFMRCYISFVDHFEDAMEALRAAQKQRAFVAFVRTCSLKLDLSGYLIMPVQRLARYPLLLKELLQVTPPEHPDAANLAAGLSAVQELAALVNARKREAQLRGVLVALQQTFGGDARSPFVAPHRHIVGVRLAHDAFDVLGAQAPLALIVCNDTLLLLRLSAHSPLVPLLADALGVALADSDAALDAAPAPSSAAATLETTTRALRVLISPAVAAVAPPRDQFVGSFVFGGPQTRIVQRDAMTTTSVALVDTVADRVAVLRCASADDTGALREALSAAHAAFKPPTVSEPGVSDLDRLAASMDLATFEALVASDTFDAVHVRKRRVKTQSKPRWLSADAKQLACWKRTRTGACKIRLQLPISSVVVRERPVGSTGRFVATFEVESRLPEAPSFVFHVGAPDAIAHWSILASLSAHGSLLARKTVRSTAPSALSSHSAALSVGPPARRTPFVRSAVSSLAPAVGDGESGSGSGSSGSGSDSGDGTAVSSPRAASVPMQL